MGNHYSIYALEEYREWFDAESEKSRYQIQNRISRIENSGHFGSVRSLKKQLWELKFNDGRRIYYTIIPEKNLILLLGGNKNGQKKDIQKARKIIAEAQKLKVSDFKSASRVKPSSYLIDEQNVGLAILECLQNNDPEGVMEVVGIYLAAMNKAKLIEAGEIPKSTFYHSLKNKNPTLKTLAKMVSSYTHADG